MYVVQNQTTTRHHFPIFVIDSDGWLVDPFEIKFRIVRVSDGSQVFPASGWEDVTDEGYDTGYFYAYDVSESDGWKVDPAEAAGKCYIEWNWTVESGDAAQSTKRRFYIELSASFSGVEWISYIAPTQVRDEGIDTDDLSNARLEELLFDAQDYIETKTQNVFRPVWQDFRVNGPHGSQLFLPLPVIAVSAVYANGSTSMLSHDSVRVNHAVVTELDRFQPRPDPRRNPWIRFRGIESGPGNFSWPTSLDSTIFHRGANNQRIVGAFGFMERDGSVPRQIREAMLRLIVANAESLEVGDEAASGPVVSRTTDRNSISYAASGLESSLSWSGATSKRVEEILINYRRPIGLGTTAPSHSWRV